MLGNMKMLWTPQTGRDALWTAYRSNLSRHLIGLSRHLQSETMHRLSGEMGHEGLRLSFEAFITLIANRDCRLTELAEWLSISKQACNQAANEIEKAGYIQRLSDPSDGRAKILTLSPRGQSLVNDGARVTRDLEKHYAALLGIGEFRRFASLLSQLYDALQLPRLQLEQWRKSQAILISALLPRISDYVMQRLMRLTIAKGHPGLKMSHGQVLSLIGDDGSHISQIASIQEISKQAVSAIAKDLETLGYIERRAGPDNSRQTLLRLTNRGEMLLRDSVDSMRELENEFSVLLGKEGLDQLKSLSAALFRHLHLEEDVFSPNTDLKLMAEQIRQQLGAEGSRALATLLYQPVKEIAS